ncbi:TPA: hypothetical protein MH547_09180 [Klebsiella pneumoniae]|nr:hypothetical protein [Klebsiella pneumoniae]
MTVIVLMWEEAAIKDDVIEYDIAFNIIYIMRTHVVVAKDTANIYSGGSSEEDTPPSLTPPSAFQNY